MALSRASAASLARSVRARIVASASAPVVPTATPARPGIGIPSNSVYTHDHTQTRRSSHSPMGSPPANRRKKVTMSTLRSMYKKREPITMITAHDFPSAHVADHAGMDMILVGDSLAMVALGMEDTSEIVLEEMLLHCRSVARATQSAFTVRLSPWLLLSSTPSP